MGKGDGSGDKGAKGIIRKTITWGAAIILAILFAKQIKKMNK